MAKRHNDAILIQSAVNPSGIALSLHEAFKEVIREGGDTKALKEDAACRLILHQLCYLCNIGTGIPSLAEYRTLIAECRDRQQESSVKTQDTYEGFDVPAEAIETGDPDTDKGYRL